MPLDDIHSIFAKLANMVDEENNNPKELAIATAALALARVVITDLRRIADAQEAMAKEYLRVQAGTL